MIGRVLQKGIFEQGFATAPEHDADRTKALAERAAVVREHVAGEGIEAAEELARLKVDVFIAAFKLVEFLEHRDRDRDVVLFKVADASAVVKDHVRVEHEELRPCLGHGASGGGS